MRSRTVWAAAAVAAVLSLVGVTLAEGGKKGAPTGDKAGCNKGQVRFGKPADAGAVADKAGDKAGDKGGKGGQRPGFGRPGGPGAQGGGPGRPGGGGFRGQGAGADAIIERLMALDKNKDGKLSKDELPERMQAMLEKGDTNKDGALDKDELKKAVADFAQGGFGGRGGPGGFGFGFGGPGGPGAPGGRGPGGIDRALADLNLKDKKKDSAEAAVKAYQDNVKKLTDLARSDLLVKMKEVLSEEEFKKFKEAVERQPAPPFGGPGFGPPRGASAPSGTADLEKKVEQLQKEIEALRKQIKPEK